MASVVRSLFAASEPTHILRPGERIIGAVEAVGTMTEWMIESKTKRRKRFSRFDAHGRLRKRRRR